MFASMRGLVAAAVAGSVVIGGVGAAIAATQPAVSDSADAARTRSSLTSCTVDPEEIGVKERDRDRLKSEDCTPTADASKDQDRLRDGTCDPDEDCSGDQDRDRLRSGTPTADSDKDQDRLRTRDQTSKTAEASTGAGSGSEEPAVVRERVRTRTETCQETSGDVESGGSGSAGSGGNDN